jgi:hypothetical protein
VRGRNLVKQSECVAGTCHARCSTHSVIGYERPANSAHKYIYNAVLRLIFPNAIQYNSKRPFAQWLAKDIEQVFILLVPFCTFQLTIPYQLTELPDSISYIIFWRFCNFFWRFCQRSLESSQCSPIRSRSFRRRNVPTLTKFLRILKNSEVQRRRPPGMPRKRA